MTGIFLPPSSASTSNSKTTSSSNNKFRKDDTPAKRYKLLKKIPEHYSILQLGICLFEEKQPKKPTARSRKGSAKKNPPAAEELDEAIGEGEVDDDEEKEEEDQEMVSIFDNAATAASATAAAAAAAAAAAKVEDDEQDNSNSIPDDGDENGNVDHEGYIVVSFVDLGLPI